MTSRPFSLLALLVALSSLSAIHARAQFDYIRFDVSFNSQYFGYMVFSDSGPVPGNIYPNIVDWEFTFNGFVFDTSNTVPWDNGYFEVDGNYQFQSDFNGGLAPCFSSTGLCGLDPIAIGITRGLNLVLTINPPGGNEVYSGGQVSYSRPVFLSALPRPVPTAPGIALALMAFALVGVVAFARRRHRAISRRCEA